MAKRMTAARDHAMDRKSGIKQGSARDMKLDRARGVKDSKPRKGRK